MVLEGRAHIEAWGGKLLGELVVRGKDGLSKEAQNYAGWARQDFAWFRRLEKTRPGLSSWNWDVVLAACLLWLEPGVTYPGNDRYTVVQWWREWLALQVGDASADAPLPNDDTRTLHTAPSGMGASLAAHYPLTRFFDGSETLSSVYGAARYGAVFAVRLLALRNPEHPAAPELIGLTERYMEVLATLLSLSSAPWTDPGYRAENGRMWYSGPTWGPVGERSEAAGLQCAQGAILGTLRGEPLLNQRASRPEYASVPWLVTLLSEFHGHGSFAAEVDSSQLAAIGVEDLVGARLWSETHWLRWKEGLLVYSPKRLNPNTPRIFWAWLDDQERRMTIGYPFSAEGRHRGKGASGAQGECRLDGGVAGGWRITASGIDGGQPAALALPVSGAPLWHIVGDREGFRMVKP